MIGGDQDGLVLQWSPMLVNGHAMDVPYVSVEGYHVSGEDVLLPSSPALRMVSPETTPGQDEMHLSQLAGAPNDAPPAALAAAEDQTDTQRQAFGATLTNVHCWPNRQVPYAIQTGLKPSMLQTIFAGMKLWQPAVKFVQRTSEQSYVFFVDTTGSSRSYLGRVGGKQPIYLKYSADATAAAHEIGHALGLDHEHQRDDRDNHITIIWSNVASAWRYWLETFRSHGEHQVALTSYDVDSIMHYGSYYYAAIDYRKPWLTKKNGGAISRATRPSYRDMQSLVEIDRLK